MAYKDHLRTLIANNKRRLQSLEEQREATGIETPPHILMEIEDLEEKISDLERNLSSLKIDEGEQPDGTELEVSHKSTPQMENIKRQIVIRNRRLQILKEREAQQGFDTPPSVLVEIEDLEEEIEQLVTDLKALQSGNADQSVSLIPRTDQVTSSREDDLKKLKNTYERRLIKLKEQWALRGSHTSPEILTEIEDIEAELEKLQATLESSEGKDAEEPLYDFGQLRRLLNNTFDEPGLDAFSLNYFISVYDRFSRGMRKDEKISLLLDDCRRRPDGLEQLLDALKHEAKIDDAARSKLEVTPTKDKAEMEIAELVQIQPTYGDPDTIANYLEIVRVQCGQVETRPYFQLSNVPGTPPRLSLMGDEGFGGVYIPLRFDLSAQQDVDLTEVLTDTNHIVIVGGAGSGKTTILRYLAMVLSAQDPARNRVDLAWTVRSLPLPILVALRDFGHACQAESNTYQRNPDSFLRFIDDHFERWHPERVPKGFLSDLIKSGNAWLLFDGLDEIANFDHRVAMRHLIEQLVNISSQNRLIVTARVAAYADTRTQLNEHFSKVTVRDLTRDQWQPMLRRIYTGLESRSDVAKDRIERLTTRIDVTPLLQSMVKTPLMVWTATLIHYAGSELPEQRAELYSAYTDILLGERLHEEENPDAAQSLREERWPMKDRRLYLTYAAQQVHKMAASEQVGTSQLHSHVVVDEFDLVKRILGPFMQDYLGLNRRRAEQEAEDFIMMMAERSGLLHAHKAGYSFGDHLTIQEYLTAHYLVENVRSNTQDWLAFLQTHVGQSWWEQVFMLIFGCLLESPQQARRFLLDELGSLSGQGDAPFYGLAWAGRAFLEIPTGQVGWYEMVHNELSQRLLKALSQHSNNVSIEARIEVGEVLGLLGDIRFHSDYGLPSFVNMSGDQFWMGSDQTEIDTLAQRIPPQQLVRQLQLSHWMETADTATLDIQQAFVGESPRHQVKLSNFAIAAYPTTNAMFANFINDESYTDKRWWDQAIAAKTWIDGQIIDPLGERSQPAYWNEVGFNGLNQPVIGITWYEAVAYCRWLTHRLHTAGQLRPTELIRLPTEAEWERVARNASVSADGKAPEAQTYPWGNDWELGWANIEELGLERTTPVGIFAGGATSDGIFDLAGNVSEWCNDWYSPDIYQQRAGQITENPTGPSTGKYKVLRGGSWQNDQYFVRSAFRDRESPQNRSRSIGFRLVKSEVSSESG